MLKRCQELLGIKPEDHLVINESKYFIGLPVLTVLELIRDHSEEFIKSNQYILENCHSEEIYNSFPDLEDKAHLLIRHQPKYVYAPMNCLEISLRATRILFIGLEEDGIIWSGHKINDGDHCVIIYRSNKSFKTEMNKVYQLYKQAIERPYLEEVRKNNIILAKTFKNSNRFAGWWEIEYVN